MKSQVLRSLLLCTSLLLAGAGALAQGRGPGGGGPGGGGQGPGGGGQGGPGGAMGSRPDFGQPNSSFPGNSTNNRAGAPPQSSGPRAADSTMRGGLQLAPPGRWWDDKTFAKSLGLSKDQQKKMDQVFNVNKSSILDSYKNLKKEESQLETLTKQPKLNEARIFAAIDSVAQARAALEKANAHMLLQVRQEMDADQLGRMDKFRAAPPEE